jgi:demethylmenaquinone methyltransferase/2-methoxy-6-polyprenyl-1,4-benzoquinol methylase
MATTSDERPRDEAETDFGFRRVRQEDHAGMVSAVFDSVADRYDLMNDLMSGGLHRLWKQALIDWLNPRAAMRLMDVAGGTGDIALRALERVANRDDTAPRQVTICDPNYSMLHVAKGRVIDEGHLDGVTLVCAPAETLPVRSRTYDACTISFGLRNVTDRQTALSELHRILDLGGHFLCLEFSPSVMPLLGSLYDTYSYRVLPWLGERVAGDREAYQYLAESIRRFPDPETLAGEMREAGFANVTHRSLSGGIVAIHSGWRI